MWEILSFGVEWIKIHIWLMILVFVSTSHTPMYFYQLDYLQPNTPFMFESSKVTTAVATVQPNTCLVSYMSHYFRR